MTYCLGGTMVDRLRRENSSWQVQSPWRWQRPVLFLVLRCTTSTCYMPRSHSLAVIQMPVLLMSRRKHSCYLFRRRNRSEISVLTIWTVRLCRRRASLGFGVDILSFILRPRRSLSFPWILLPLKRWSLDRPTWPLTLLEPVRITSIRLQYCGGSSFQTRKMLSSRRLLCWLGLEERIPVCWPSLQLHRAFHKRSMRLWSLWWKQGGPR